jgi:hypothetical protein
VVKWGQPLALHVEHRTITAPLGRPRHAVCLTAPLVLVLTPSEAVTAQCCPD